MNTLETTPLWATEPFVQPYLREFGYNHMHILGAMTGYYPPNIGYKRAALIAEDFSFTKQTQEQRYDSTNPMPRYL